MREALGTQPGRVRTRLRCPHVVSKCVVLPPVIMGAWESCDIVVTNGNVAGWGWGARPGTDVETGNKCK